jgi:rhodanese-related sulfurtransferase
MRQKLIHQLRMDRVSVDELSGMLSEAQRPLLIDVRPDDLRVRTGWIPGAIVLAEIAELESQELHEVVVYCDCPNEVSAAKVAQQLKQLGFRRVRPLTGGMSAWLARGLPVAMA